jgi:hypothetical protein
MSEENTVTEVSNQLQTERLQEVDRMALELAKANRKTALANAEKALAQNETAELAYKYVVLQICMKYGLTDADLLNEDGSFVRGGAATAKASQK